MTSDDGRFCAFCGGKMQPRGVIVRDYRATVIIVCICMACTRIASHQFQIKGY